MSAPTNPADLLDLKMMPAWVNEPSRTSEYSAYQGDEEQHSFDRLNRGLERGREARPRPAKRREQRDRGRRPEPRREHRTERSVENVRPRPTSFPLPQVAVRFLPHPAAFESVIGQIKSGTLAYSVFALARMFLDKPARYDVQLTTSSDAPLYQLGENGAVAANRNILEGSAFAHAKDDFYAEEVTQSDPVKGNFSNVARDRVSGTLLGPTNHHSYQPQLRSLYEQRYSRRMSFPDYQRQIEIVSDPAAVEAWKEQARSVTTYTTRKVELSLTFTSLAEAERHFRQTHLPSLLRLAPELTIGGSLSRRLPDRGLNRVIEDAWSAEIRSPSRMMQELAGGFRGAGLHIFRHRKGMLFVSPVRMRSFNHESTGVSASINSILTTIAEMPGISRKQLAEKLVSGLNNPAESDRVKLSLASDLRWLITEGCVIEFNDGSLDLPRVKPLTQGKAGGASESAQPAAAVSEVNPVAISTAPKELAHAEEPSPSVAETLTDGLSLSQDAGGMTVDQRVEPKSPPLDEIASEAPSAREEDGEDSEPAEAPRS